MSANLLANGDFLFFQRGNVFENVPPTGVKVADRWWGASSASVAENIFLVREDQPNVSGGRNALLMQRRPGSAQQTTLRVIQALSSKESLRATGNDVVATVWAAAGTNFSGTSFKVAIISGTGYDLAGNQPFAWPGLVIQPVGNFAPSSAVAPYSGVAHVPHNATQLAMLVSYTTSGLPADADDSLTVYAADLRLGTTPPVYCDAEDEAVAWTRVAAYYEELANPRQPWVKHPSICPLGPAFGHDLTDGVQTVTVPFTFTPKRHNNWTPRIVNGPRNFHITDPVSGDAIFDLTVAERGAPGEHRGRMHGRLEARYAVGTYDSPAGDGMYRAHWPITRGVQAIFVIDTAPTASLAIDCDI